MFFIISLFVGNFWSQLNETIFTCDKGYIIGYIIKRKKYTEPKKTATLCSALSLLVKTKNLNIQTKIVILALY